MTLIHAFTQYFACFPKIMTKYLMFLSLKKGVLVNFIVCRNANLKSVAENLHKITVSGYFYSGFSDTVDM